MAKLRAPFTIVAIGIAAVLCGGDASAPALSPEQFIAARKASFDMSAITMAEMKNAVTNGLDIRKQDYPAKVLGRWARVLPTLFPKGTGPGETSVETHAQPSVWNDRAGFEKAAAAYASAADKLAAFASASDTAGFSTQLAVVSKTCDSCHDTYKVKY